MSFDHPLPFPDSRRRNAPTGLTPTGVLPQALTTAGVNHRPSPAIRKKTPFFPPLPLSQPLPRPSPRLPQKSITAFPKLFPSLPQESIPAPPTPLPRLPQESAPKVAPARAPLLPHLPQCYIQSDIAEISLLIGEFFNTLLLS